MAIGVVSFPAELDTLSTLVEVRGNASTTIDAPGIDADDTTIPVPDTSSFPNTGVLASEGEQISYTGKTATSFTGCEFCRGPLGGYTHSPASDRRIAHRPFSGYC